MAGAGPLSRVSVQNPSSGGGSSTVSVSNFPTTQPVSGSVSVSNFPAVQAVSDNGGSLTVDGTVNVGNFPQSQSVSVSNFPTTQAVSGSVTVGNFPATQQVSDAGGSLTVDSPQLPASLGVKAAAASLSVTPSSDGVFTTADRGSASIATGQVAINNTTAVQIVAARATRRKVTLAPTSQFTYFVGNTGVTATTGFAVLNGGAFTLDTTAAVFVVGQSNGTMTFMETF